jgi:hypothetical protein
VTDRDEYSTCKVCQTGIRRHRIGGKDWGAWLHDNQRGWGIVPAAAHHRAEPVEEPT